jgi:hypothetical protein
MNAKTVTRVFRFLSPSIFRPPEIELIPVRPGTPAVRTTTYAIPFWVREKRLAKAKASFSPPIFAHKLPHSQRKCQAKYLEFSKRIVIGADSISGQGRLF